jgi:cytochrome c oxidase subunit 4
MAKARSEKSLWDITKGPLATWCALCALLTATCAIAFVPLGSGNLPISLLIAAAKASLVGLFFMRLRNDSPLNRLAACLGPVWILIMFLLLGADYFTR